MANVDGCALCRRLLWERLEEPLQAQQLNRTCETIADRETRLQVSLLSPHSAKTFVLPSPLHFPHSVQLHPVTPSVKRSCLRSRPHRAARRYAPSTAARVARPAARTMPVLQRTPTATSSALRTSGVGGGGARLASFVRLTWLRWRAFSIPSHFWTTAAHAGPAWTAPSTRTRSITDHVRHTVLQKVSPGLLMYEK